jgi:DNA-binding NtrC family response regulator
MDPFAEVIGSSPALAALKRQLARLVAQSTPRRLPPVLILGETGTGKGLLARAIHRASPRAAGPFVAVNCAAIPDNMLESEMFGFERGAFTDARYPKPGLFQTANRGMLFLDEVGALPLPLQAKILTCLEDRAVRRLGSTRPDPVDAWILAATSEDLPTAMRARRFREDLYHRLSAVTILLPPLRDRGSDIVPLAEHFLGQACTAYGLAPRRLSPEASAALRAYPWPGNIRELTNVMERVALLSEDPVVRISTLALPVAAPPGETREGREPLAALVNPAAPLKDSVAEFERSQLVAALESTHWNLSRAAVRLGIPRNTLRYRMERHALIRSRAASGSAPQSRPLIERVTVGHLDKTPPDDESPGERRLLTFLGILVHPVSPAVSASVVRAALAAVMDKVQAFGGRLEELEDSGVLAVFGIDPTEDASVRAVHTALAVRRTARRTRAAYGPSWTETAAVHVHQCLIRRSDSLPVIDATDGRTARDTLDDLTAGAEPDTITVSATTVPFVERRFLLRDRTTPSSAKGRICEVLGPEPTGLGLGGRALSPFIERERELDVLSALLIGAQRGEGHIVGIMGEAGVGKSRLAYEFRQALTARDVQYLEGRCLAFRANVPYGPVIDLIKQTLGLTETDPPKGVADRVREELKRFDLNPDGEGLYLSHLLGSRTAADRVAALAPEAIRHRTFEALRQLWMRATTERALVITVEDLHWSDTTSATFLGWLVERLANARILILATYRPGYRADWMGRSCATQLALQPLSADACRHMVRAVLGPERSSDDALRAIVPRAAGNPFFVEELTWALKEQPDPKRFPAIPETVHEAILARINQLPEPSRRLLKTAAVLGRDISLPLLDAIWADADSLESALEPIARLEFLQPRATTTERAYTFKHALIQEVAYESLAPGQRRVLHAAAGRALERLWQGRLDEVEDRLAHHYAEAQDAENAIRYLVRCANRAARAYSHVEAATAVQRARILAATVGQKTERHRLTVDLVLREVDSLHFLGRTQEALDVLKGHRHVVDELHDPWRAGSFYFWLARTYSVLTDRAQAAEYIAAALETAERCGDDVTAGRSLFLRGFEEYCAGQLREGVISARRATELLHGDENQWWLGMSYWVVAQNLLLLGQLEEATGSTARLAAIAEATDDSRLQSYAAWLGSWISVVEGQHERAIAAGRRGLEQARDPVSLAYASGQLGYAYLEAGEIQLAIPLLDRAIEGFGGFHPPSRRSQSRLMARLSEAYLRNRQIDLADTSATKGLEISLSIGYPYTIGLNGRALGLVLETRGEWASAEARLTDALRTFESMQAVIEVATTLSALGRLYSRSGCSKAASQSLRRARDLYATLRLLYHADRVESLAGDLGIDLDPGASRPDCGTSTGASPEP